MNNGLYTTDLTSYDYRQNLKSGLQYCLCVLMAVTLESFLQFYFFLLVRCYSAMRVKAWSYKLQIALQNLSYRISTTRNIDRKLM